MKGIIFNELERMVTDERGLGTWDKILQESPLKTPEGLFIAPKDYPDEDFHLLIESVCKHYGKPQEEFLHLFGRRLLAPMMEKYSYFVSPGTTIKMFLRKIHEIIHVEVKKLYPGAVTATIDYEDPADDRLIMIYRSPRNLCSLALGLLESAGPCFEVDVDIEKTSCSKKGDDGCRFELTFREIQ